MVVMPDLQVALEEPAQWAIDVIDPGVEVCVASNHSKISGRRCTDHWKDGVRLAVLILRSQRHDFRRLIRTLDIEQQGFPLITGDQTVVIEGKYPVTEDVWQEIIQVAVHIGVSTTARADKPRYAVRELDRAVSCVVLVHAHENLHIVWLRSPFEAGLNRSLQQGRPTTSWNQHADDWSTTAGALHTRIPGSGKGRMK